ncbi:DMT family transporter [Alterinioella nitratireducens]|uniref:DMT family transporter n=1 Tax=Alterinioella nitratireducens TaxID=2735915 RepID=UPI00155808D6|nr:DMT family transporter [Alterinioella nitratireducens]NPD19975.1 DMT family transporter [Alterinioella nitratireducens]
MILTPNMRGAGFMMASMAAFTFNDVCVKLLAGTLPLMQIVFLRGILTVGMMIGLARVMGLRRLTIPRGDRWLVAGRTGTEVASMVAFLIALINMPIANVSAVMAALPLTVTLAGAVVLNEPVGWKRLSAILVGMIGVLLIVQPGGDGFNAYSLVALIAVILITAREMFTRRFSAEVPSMAVAVITALSVCAFGGIATLVTGEWAPVEPRAGALVAIAAVFIIGGYVFSIMVMRVGEIGFVAPFRYTMLIWALVLGWLVFEDWPNAFTQAGAVIVVATGVFTLYRERKVRQGDG